jgi:hypothetical protein
MEARQVMAQLRDPGIGVGQLGPQGRPTREQPLHALGIRRSRRSTVQEAGHAKDVGQMACERRCVGVFVDQLLCQFDALLERPCAGVRLAESLLELAKPDVIGRHLGAQRHVIGMIRQERLVVVKRLLQ